jgi:hypothetical protein
MYGGPEYETAASFGSLCMNDNLPSIAKANELCNKYTIDTISTGSAVAFAMECYEKGLLTKKDTGGLDLTWGNHQAIVKLVEKIGMRDGLGDLVAEGVKRAAEKIEEALRNLPFTSRVWSCPCMSLGGRRVWDCHTLHRTEGRAVSNPITTRRLNVRNASPRSWAFNPPLCQEPEPT